MKLIKLKLLLWLLKDMEVVVFKDYENTDDDSILKGCYKRALASIQTSIIYVSSYLPPKKDNHEA